MYLYTAIVTIRWKGKITTTKCPSILNKRFEAINRDDGNEKRANNNNNNTYIITRYDLNRSIDLNWIQINRRLDDYYYL